MFEGFSGHDPTNAAELLNKRVAVKRIVANARVRLSAPIAAAVAAGSLFLAVPAGASNLATISVRIGVARETTDPTDMFIDKLVDDTEGPPLVPRPVGAFGRALLAELRSLGWSAAPTVAGETVLGFTWRGRHDTTVSVEIGSDGVAEFFARDSGGGQWFAEAPVASARPLLKAEVLPRLKKL